MRTSAMPPLFGRFLGAARMEVHAMSMEYNVLGGGGKVERGVDCRWLWKKCEGV